jgi:hypothetical protein
VRNIVRGLKLAWKEPRWRTALIIAAVSDVVSVALAPVPIIQWLVDGVTAMVLLMILGFSWPLLLALGVEAIPALEVFPTWIVVVVVLAGTHGRDARGGEGPPRP